MGALGGFDRAVLSAGPAGLLPLGVEQMMHVTFLQQWHALADEALEDAPYDNRARCAFLREGTIVDATISNKNQARVCDPEMHQTKKGNAWHFGMKAQMGGNWTAAWCTPW